MKCISVYTNDFEQFSDIYEAIIQTPLQEDEEKEVEGVMIYGAGEVPAQYVDRMRQKRGRRDEGEGFGHHHLAAREQFEIILPEQ